jgi:hypothetical protein
MKHRLGRLKRLALIAWTRLATTEALPEGSIIPVRELIADSREDNSRPLTCKIRVQRQGPPPIMDDSGVLFVEVARQI